MVATEPDPIFLGISPGDDERSTNQGGRDEIKAPKAESGNSRVAPAAAADEVRLYLQMSFGLLRSPFTALVQLFG